MVEDAFHDLRLFVFFSIERVEHLRMKGTVKKASISTLL